MKEFYKPKTEQSDLFKEWQENKEATLLKIIRYELSKLDYKPAKIIIDGNALSILYKYFEYKIEKYEIDGIPVERTWNKINYFEFGE